MKRRKIRRLLPDE